MSIIELSKTVENLAEVVNQKNREVEELKKGYDEKLQLINSYISKIQSTVCSSQCESDGKGDDSRMDNAEFLSVMTKPIHCSHCDKVIWDNQKQTEFVLIPRVKLEYLLQSTSDVITSSTVTSVSDQMKSMNINRANGPEHSIIQNNSHHAYSNKSKRLCSFCKKPGHSRAKCNLRLSMPINESKSME